MDEGYCDELERENKRLRGEVSKLQEIVSNAEANDARYLLAKYIYLRTPDNSQIINDSRGSFTRLDFERWQTGITEPLKKQASAMRGLLFKISMESILKQRPEFKRIPFIYHDFHEDNSLYTPAVLELMNIDEERAKEMTLIDFIRTYVEKNKRKNILDAFNKKISLENYAVNLADIGETRLNGYPLCYGREPVGVALFIYQEEKVNKFSAIRFALTLRKGISELSSEFEVIRKK